MVKKTLIIGSMILLSGCAERGSAIDLYNTQANGSRQHTLARGNNGKIPTLVVHHTREDKVQKNISASLIIIIGLVLVL